MKKVLILGCGNILAGDDGVGVEVVQALQKEVLPPAVELVEAGVPGLSLLELLPEAEKVIIVDAVEGRKEPGKVLRLTEADLPPAQLSSPLSVHEIGIAEALAWLRNLEPEKAPPELVIIGIQVAKVERWKQGLSPPVAAAIPQAVVLVKKELGYPPETGKK